MRPLGVATTSSTIVVGRVAAFGGRRGAARSSEERERDEDDRSGPGPDGSHGLTVRPQTALLASPPGQFLGHPKDRDDGHASLSRGRRRRRGCPGYPRVMSTRS